MKDEPMELPEEAKKPTEGKPLRMELKVLTVFCCISSFTRFGPVVTVGVILLTVLGVRMYYFMDKSEVQSRNREVETLWRIVLVIFGSITLYNVLDSAYGIGRN